MKQSSYTLLRYGTYVLVNVMHHANDQTFTTFSLFSTQEEPTFWSVVPSALPRICYPWIKRTDSNWTK